MRGFLLVGKGDDYKIVMVQSVMDGSPAADAGVLKGDIITAIDGRSADEYSLEQIRRLLMEDGLEVSMGVKRDEATFDALLTLKRLI